MVMWFMASAIALVLRLLFAMVEFALLEPA